MRFLPIAAALVLSLGSAGGVSAQYRVWPAPAQTGHAIEETVITGIGVASTVLVQRTDARVRNWATSDPTTHIPIHGLDRVFRPMGGHLPLAGAGLVTVAGMVAGDDQLRDAGVITVESLGATMALKAVVARVIGRMRPQADPHEPGSWELLGGLKGRDHRSFPSGHAANAFALATAITEELHHVGSPVYPWAAGALYTAATATSFSRVLDDEHWLSDVVAGMALGGVTGAVIADWNGR